MTIIKLTNGYLNTDGIFRARKRTTRRLDPGAGLTGGQEYEVPPHLWIKTTSGEVLELEGADMRRVLRVLDKEAI